uniref:Uncharacterized protein n=1 Tax=Chromera velia CCMP2878 TaxID=1169474 RepID=A0A0G4HLH1_9ALVE|eukprot:Cvel_7371.t1-p1 / transcript=Cvel_7371.t1 / gene=Cvel_7371 / organism=Chromera_velia_CCMP2878 / gene_product=hypothetical protein / transcript_product=hypothetical protein / location=Cvel_scaffold383:67058-71107(-) / protein_length=1030 / sequence_SO=supercontig / SO=protein_coding / is_pseudo=false
MRQEKVTFIKLISQPPVEIELFVGSGAVFPLRLVCKDLNERILSTFGVTGMTINCAITQTIGAPFLHWLMEFPETPPSEALLAKMVEIGQGHLLLELHKYPQTTYVLYESVPRRYIWNREQVMGFSNTLALMEAFAKTASHPHALMNFKYFADKFKRQVLRHLKVFFKKCAWHAAAAGGDNALAMIKYIKTFKTQLRASFGDETDITQLKRVHPEFINRLMRERWWNEEKKRWEPYLHLHLHPALSVLCLRTWRGDISAFMKSGDAYTTPMPDPAEFETRKPIHPPLVVTRLMWYAIRGGHDECAKAIYKWGDDLAVLAAGENELALTQYRRKVANPRCRRTNKPPAEAAAQMGNIPMLEWMRAEERVVRFAFDQWVVKAAIEGKQVGVLDYLWHEIRSGVPHLPMPRWSRKLPDAARAQGAWECLRRLRAQDPPCKWGEPEPGDLFGHGTVVARRIRAYEVKVAEFIAKDKVNDPPPPPQDIREEVSLFIRHAVKGTTLLSAKRVLQEREWRLFNWLCRMGGHDFEERRMVRLGYRETVEIMRKWVTVLHWHLTTKWPSFVHGLERAGQRYDKMVANLNRDQEGFARFHMWVKSHNDDYEKGLSHNAKRSLREIVKHSGEEHLRWMLEDWSPWDRPPHLQPRIAKQPMWLKRRRRKNKIRRRRRARARRQEKEDKEKICTHGLALPDCQECYGKALCAHNRKRSKCPKCTPPPKGPGPAPCGGGAAALPAPPPTAKAKAKAKAKTAAASTQPDPASEAKAESPKANAKAKQQQPKPKAVLKEAAETKASKNAANAKAKAKQRQGLLPSNKDKLVILKPKETEKRAQKGLAAALKIYNQQQQKNDDRSPPAASAPRPDPQARERMQQQEPEPMPVRAPVASPGAPLPPFPPGPSHRLPRPPLPPFPFPPPLGFPSPPFPPGGGVAPRGPGLLGPGPGPAWGRGPFAGGPSFAVKQEGGGPPSGPVPFAVGAARQHMGHQRGAPRWSSGEGQSSSSSSSSSSSGLRRGSSNSSMDPLMRVKEEEFDDPLER